jgi:hypothetical protein
MDKHRSILRQLCSPFSSAVCPACHKPVKGNKNKIKNPAKALAVLTGFYLFSALS